MAILAGKGWTKTDLGREFQITTRQIAILLGGIPANGDKEVGNPTYLMRDVALVLGAYKANIKLHELQEHAKNSQQNNDPKNMSPKEKRDHWEAKRAETRYLEEQGVLVKKSLMRSSMSSLLQRAKAFFVTLPDVLEREMGLTPDQAIKLTKAVTILQRELHSTIMSQELKKGEQSWEEREAAMHPDEVEEAA